MPAHPYQLQVRSETYVRAYTYVLWFCRSYDMLVCLLCLLCLASGVLVGPRVRDVPCVHAYVRSVLGALDALGVLGACA